MLQLIRKAGISPPGDGTRRRFTLGSLWVVTMVAVVILAACVRGSADTPSPRPTSEHTPVPIQAAATPTPTEQPVTPVPSSTPLGGTLPVLHPSELAIPGCSTTPPGYSGPGGGTAPAPTPVSTPTGTAGERDPELAAEEAAKFIAHAAPLWEQVTHWSVLLQDSWRQSREPETQAGLIQVMGDRLSQACRSLGLIDAPVEALDARAALVSSIQERHRWAVDAADELRCCGDAQTGALDERSEQTHELIVNAAIPVHALADKYALTVEPNGAEREISSEVLDLAVVLPARWVMVRNDAQVVALAPYAYQIATVGGVGPAGWNHGTAARVRTLRNPEPVSPEELRERLATVAGAFGDVEDERSLLIDGREAHEYVVLVVLNEESTWRMRIVAVVVGKFTVFVEMGCPMEHEDGCRDLLDSFAAGLWFQG